MEIFAYLRTTRWPEYLELAEQLNMVLLRIIADAGASLTVPIQALEIDAPGDVAASAGKQFLQT